MIVLKYIVSKLMVKSANVKNVTWVETPQSVKIIIKCMVNTFMIQSATVPNVTWVTKVINSQMAVMYTWISVMIQMTIVVTRVANSQKVLVSK